MQRTAVALGLLLALTGTVEALSIETDLPEGVIALAGPYEGPVRFNLTARTEPADLCGPTVRFFAGFSAPAGAGVSILFDPNQSSQGVAVTKPGEYEFSSRGLIVASGDARAFTPIDVEILVAASPCGPAGPVNGSVLRASHSLTVETAYVPFLTVDGPNHVMLERGETRPLVFNITNQGNYPTRAFPRAVWERGDDIANLTLDGPVDVGFSGPARDLANPPATGHVYGNLTMTYKGNALLTLILESQPLIDDPPAPVQGLTREVFVYAYVPDGVPAPEASLLLAAFAGLALLHRIGPRRP